MDKVKVKEGLMIEDDLGLMLREMESYEKFFPCYKTMSKK